MGVVNKNAASASRRLPSALPYSRSPTQITLIWRDKRALAAIYAVFLALLGLSWAFVISRESTLSEVFLTFALPLVIVSLFFFLQAMFVGYENGGSIKGLFQWAWLIWPKLLAVSLPLILLAGVLLYLASRFSQIGFIFLLILAFLPLPAIHFWLAAARYSVLGAWRNSGRLFALSLSPGAILVYAAGLFGVAGFPYLLTQARLPLPGRWQIVWFVTRLALALGVAVFSWLALVQALKTKARFPTE